ncbi:unnamed protein product [Rotaria magnacalcarata]|uniref:Cadherin domain-containing protein n=2 Tax=Rotaria magnacalcarata TaxID=392030 RepID=A0A816QGS7_9BILA|nr:unnamed protein product [Rotaria magnacalcarata]CAF3930945.1 unnamed protein product [Rotaria magnacalcarata]
MIFLRLLLIIYLTDATFLFFERDSYEFYTSEAAPVSTKIGVIQATSSSALTIEYELHGDTYRIFHLNSSTGELSLLNTLDYETIAIHKLTIEARSSSTITPCYSEIIIHVVNINDNLPEINLIFYPSVLFELNLIKYDLNTYSTPLATINIKDVDESTQNLSLLLNDTDHFQIQFVRQIKHGLVTESIYILSTKNNTRLIDQEYYYLSLNSCDNDQPSLWTNRSYEFHMKPNGNLCQFSFAKDNFILDIKEHLPNRTLILQQLTNKFCQNVSYIIDDTKNFYINATTGHLYTSTSINRERQSIYKLNLKVINQYNKILQTNITIRILNEYGHIPFLIRKRLEINQYAFSSLDLFNSTYCRYQPIIYNYFQLLTNCTLLKLSTPVKGKYLFHVQLNEKNSYEDTFLLEITSDTNDTLLLLFIRSQWMIIIPIFLGICLILFAMMCAMVIVRKRKYNKLRHNKQKPASLSGSEESIHDKYDAISAMSKLKVHDDHELSLSPGRTTIFFVQKSSSSSLTRDDEGYSGSSDVSENHLPVEPTILTPNQLLEQYRIYEFRTRQSMSSSPYDAPNRMNISCISPNVSLV